MIRCSYINNKKKKCKRPVIINNISSLGFNVDFLGTGWDFRNFDDIKSKNNIKHNIAEVIHRGQKLFMKN